MKTVLCLFVVLVSIAVGDGALSFGLLESETVYGETVEFCKYKDIRMLPESTIKDYDSCEKCVCTERGLSCATLPTAFSVSAPANSKCVSVRIGCVNKWRRKSNKNKKCPKSWIPREIAMVGK
ncbi:uncharacterized protein LOC132743183 [Ruditapes philippinarum]|uniref:uncharacterized protein LOC132743183 n=1 Tax=Ruditapes philippinarum TaxID=129788 RepID=UPI00295BEF94|nr:uncharacterized protein LOC132743183 [Ruditapes philippinarum]